MRYIQFLLALIVSATVITSCVDRDFAEPPFPNEVTVDIPDDQLMSIADVKALRSSSEQFHDIGMDMYIKATIVGDDQSGNIYKTLVIQDETGGIAIIIDDVELWNKYFVGKTVYVHLENMWLGDFNNLPQLGFEPVGGSMARIPAELLSSTITAGNNTGAPTAKVTTINSLGTAELNTLIQLDDVQFTSGSAGVTYADAVTQSAVNQFLEDCNGNEIIVRTSGFSSFAGDLTPAGKGSVTAILGIFGSDLQLTIRDTDDVNLTDTRCDGSTGSGGGNMDAITIPDEDLVSVADILALRVEGTEIDINQDKYLSGIVSSSDETGNFYKTVVVQDQTGGIALLVDQFDIYQTYEIGTSVYVHLQDLFISDYNGLPQLGYAPSTDNVKRIPENQVGNVIMYGTQSFSLAAQDITVSQVGDNLLNRLVQLNDVEFASSSVGDTYANAAEQRAVNHSIFDCDGNEIILRTSGFSDFADQRVPDGNGSIKGILQVFSGTYQLYLNYPEDISLSNARCNGDGGGGGSDDDNYNLAFETGEDFEDVNEEGWDNILIAGDQPWIKRSFDDNGFAEARAFQDSNPRTEAWLVSPEVNTAERSTLSFLSANAFFEHNGLSVLYSTDYTGDVTTATWEEIPANLAVASTGNYNWVESGDIDLSGFGSNIHIAFKYEGTSSANTTTFRLDDIDIE